MIESHTINHLKHKFKYIDNLTLEFSKLQSKKFRENLCKSSFQFKLDKSNVFHNIQKISFDELAISLTGWGRLYKLSKLVNEKNLFVDRESYKSFFMYCEIIDSLLFTGCPAILVKDNELQQTLDQIKTIKSLSAVLDINISIIVQVYSLQQITENCAAYADDIDVIWMKAGFWDEDLARKIKNSNNLTVNSKVLGFKYDYFDIKINHILEDLGYIFCEIEDGYVPTHDLEFA